MSVQFTLAKCPDLDDPCFHNSGAQDVLALMGYTVDDGMCGMEEAEQFVGRALLASALLESASADQVGWPGSWEGRTFHAGRTPGYLADRLSQLVELGLRAKKEQSKVSWG
ncbi:hypothetical protein [Nocardiopsis alba]|uniref:hypothetical protein n=1 Tax=Nocardiopsis alba TaxID=53437 RepID=UPI00339F4A3F